MVNIFFTDWDPAVAARDSCDKYVVKVPVEVATMLSAVHWRTGYEGPVCSGMPLYICRDDGRVMPAVGPYRDSRVIKSSSEVYRWLVKSRGNYGYAIEYGLELIEEFKMRYNKHHLSEGALLWLRDNIPKIPEGPMTQDVGLAMPNKYKDRDDPVRSYRTYLVHEKFRILEWSRGRDMPEWYREMSMSVLLDRLGVT
jgi:hypothetical protein